MVRTYLDPVVGFSLSPSGFNISDCQRGSADATANWLDAEQ